MKRVNVNIHPGPEGFWFQEPDGTILRVTTNWRGLMARVIAYRRRNKLPPGDVLKEVTDQACERSPGNCQDDPEIEHRAAVKATSLKGTVLQWLAGLRVRRSKEPLQFVPEQLMRERANVCAGCPRHAGIGAGCGSCKAAIKEIRKDLLPGLPVDERMAGCQVLGEDCGVSTWLPDVTVANSELPSCCWRRRSAPP